MQQDEFKCQIQVLSTNIADRQSKLLERWTVCRSCLIKYLESSYNCPKCNTEIHKTKPLEYIRSDPCLQEIVYKLVPNLFNGEESRKRQWNLRMINVDEPGPSTTCIKDNAIDSRILVTLKYFRGTSRLERLKAEKVLQLFPTRYLCCQPEMPVRVLKKFVQQKYDISPSLFEIDIWRGDETLLAEITLTQLIQIYGLYRERKPLELHFSLYPKFTPKKESEESGSEKLLELRTNSEKSYIEGKGVETEKIEMDNVYAQNTQVSIKNGAPLNETDKDSTIVSESETSVEMTAPSSSARNKESNDPEEEQLANNIIHNPPPDSSDEKKPCG